MKFAFDPRKAAANLRKHAVSFDEATTVFEGDPSAYTDFDPDHSESDAHHRSLKLWQTPIHQS